MTFKKLMTAFGMSLALLAGLALFIDFNTKPVAARPNLLNDQVCDRYKDYSDVYAGDDRPGRKAECKALIELYNATNGADWNDQDGRDGGWGQGSYCFWNGVICRGGFKAGDPRPQVTAIVLTNNNLVGDHLPESLGDFFYLDTLGLVGNPELVAELPIELTKLKKLQFFGYEDTGLCPPEDDDTTPENEEEDFLQWQNSGKMFVAPNDSCGDYQLIGLEVTQGVQNWINSVELVADKRTYVRAHVKRREGMGDLANVSAKLKVWRNGQLVGTLSQSNKHLGPNGEPIPDLEITVKENPDRKKVGDSFYFYIPKNLRHGEVEFEFDSGEDYDVDCQEPYDANAIGGGAARNCKVKVTFETVNKPELSFFYVKWRDRNDNYHLPDYTEYQEVKRRIRDVFPASGLRSRLSPRIIKPVQPFDIDPNSPATIPEKEKLKNDFKIIRTLLERKTTIQKYAGSFRVFSHSYHGIVVDLPDNLGLGLSNKKDEDPVSVASHHDSFIGEDFVGGSVSAHEIAHNLGRLHAPCGVTETLDSNYPHPDGNINPSFFEDNSEDNDLYGIDFYSNKIFGPTTCDLMGYNYPTWISEYTFEGLKDKLGSPIFAAANDTIPVSSAIIVSGVISPTANSGQIDSLAGLPFPGDLTLPAAGDYSLRFEDSSNQELASYSFNPDSLSEGNLEVFTLLLPWDSNTDRIVLLHNGVELDSSTASANPPTVTVTGPNGGETLSGSSAILTWSAGDPDGDSLEFIIQYSPDNGATWETIHPAWPSTSYDLDPNYIPGSDQALIRVLATDGFHTSLDQSDATFSVVKKAPVPLIYATEGEDFFVEGQTINLDGDAFDYEDGPIPEANLTWSSNRDGNLGTGESLSVEAADLSDGDHTVTLTAQDSDGMSGTDSITITIERLKTVTYTVTLAADVADANVGDGLCDSDLVTDGDQCTLRAAIQEANASEGDTTIQLQPATYNLTVVGQNEDNAATGDLDILVNEFQEVTITGAGPEQTIIDAEAITDRVFHIFDGKVTMSGITIQNGYVSDAAGGGMLLINGDITLTNTAVVSNSAVGFGFGYGGGGIYGHARSLAILDSVLKGNKSAETGTAISAGGNVLTLKNSIISNNIGESELYNTAVQLFFFVNIITDNEISHNIGDGLDVGSRSIIDNNTISHNDGTGMVVRHISTIKDSTISFNKYGGMVVGGCSITIINSTISDNSKEGDVEGVHTGSNGGGIDGNTYGQCAGSNLSLIDSIVARNTVTSTTGAFGGGIDVSHTIENLILTRTIVSNNAAIGIEGGIGGGGGIVASKIILMDSLVRDNIASDSGGGIGAAFLFMTNSTVSGNQANYGGGIEIGGRDYNGENSWIVNSTIANNTATIKGGGIYIPADFVRGSLTNTLLAGNSGGDCGGVLLDEGFNFSEYTLASNGHNLASDDTCLSFTQPGDLTNVDPQLGPLQDNGGRTPTHALSKNSPAVDGGDNAACPATDQRGFTRYNGHACDIGAYEYMPEGPVLWVNPEDVTVQVDDNSPPVSTTIGIGNPEELFVNWAASESTDWLSLSATSGTMPTVLDVTIDSMGLAEGVYPGSITIASADLQDSPQTVGIELIVGEPNTNPPGGASFVYLPVVIK